MVLAKLIKKGFKYEKNLVPFNQTKPGDNQGVKMDSPLVFYFINT